MIWVVVTGHDLRQNIVCFGREKSTSRLRDANDSPTKEALGAASLQSIATRIVHQHYQFSGTGD